MRALQTSAGLIPAVFLAVTVVTATSAEAQNPATFTSDPPTHHGAELLELSW